ncbi:hypothetical protein [Luteimonas arsenica]|uniref:hypothetical protein n=1 Tax=Luteimonas arsenica TaxID=1586242 RepID=UPI001055BE8F|nr:hypothetical protein [Luteimonas arsenica]
MSRWHGWVVLAGLLAFGVAHADSWVRPELRVVTSESGDYVARIVPGDRKVHARALLYRYDAERDGYRKLADYELQDGWAPVDVLLGDDGGLVTLDAWASMGQGTVLRVYDADGGLRFGHSLAGLVGKRASAAPASVSSLWWRCGKPTLTYGGEALRVMTWDEGELRVRLDDGSVQHDPGKGSCR